MPFVFGQNRGCNLFRKFRRFAWGIDCNHQDNAILTSSKEGKITFWTKKAKLIKRFKR
jgi:hypothetical protein